MLNVLLFIYFFFFSSRRRHTRSLCDWSSDVCSSDLIDVSGITHVINFDIPESATTYIHRIGRTGRAEASGDAISLVSREDLGTLRSEERRVGKECRSRWSPYH